MSVREAAPPARWRLGRRRASDGSIAIHDASTADGHEGRALVAFGDDQQRARFVVRSSRLANLEIPGVLAADALGHLGGSPYRIDGSSEAPRLSLSLESLGSESRRTLARRIAEMVAELHRSGVGHGALSLDAIRVTRDWDKGWQISLADFSADDLGQDADLSALAMVLLGVLHEGPFQDDAAAIDAVDVPESVRTALAEMLVPGTDWTAERLAEVLGSFFAIEPLPERPPSRRSAVLLGLAVGCFVFFLAGPQMGHLLDLTRGAF